MNRVKELNAHMHVGRKPKHGCLLYKKMPTFLIFPVSLLGMCSALSLVKLPEKENQSDYSGLIFKDYFHCFSICYSISFILFQTKNIFYTELNIPLILHLVVSYTISISLPLPGMPDSIPSICYFTHIQSFNGVAFFYFTY